MLQPRLLATMAMTASGASNCTRLVVSMRVRLKWRSIWRPSVVLVLSRTSSLVLASSSRSSPFSSHALGRAMTSCSEDEMALKIGFILQGVGRDDDVSFAGQKCPAVVTG